MTIPKHTRDELLAQASAIEITGDNVNEYLDLWMSHSLSGAGIIALFQFLVDTRAAWTAPPIMQEAAHHIISLGLVMRPKGTDEDAS